MKKTKHELRVLDEAHGKNYALYNGDSFEVTPQLPPSSVDFALYSPPFANVYTYSDSMRDAGNCVDDAEFFAHYAFLLPEIFRILRPGRLTAVHCKDLVNYKGRDGAAGLRDFPGEIIRAHQRAGFTWHSKVVLWTDPVEEQRKTKAHGLLYKQLRADSSFSRQGLPEYLLLFRKWADDAGTDVEPVTHTKESFPLERWQRWASPVWFDWDRKRVLNAKLAREDNDERHMAPLSLDVVERAVQLWTNPGDVVFSPFAGVGSEGYGSLPLKRKFVGVELKASYFSQAKRFLEEVDVLRQGALFGAAGTAE